MVITSGNTERRVERGKNPLIKALSLSVTRALFLISVFSLVTILRIGKGKVKDNFSFFASKEEEETFF